METGLENEWSRFSQWIHCFCIVTFDLNLGQAMEFLYPHKYKPSEPELNNICYMAFPDSNSSCMGDTKFHMRLRVTKHKSLSDHAKEYNNESLTALQADESHLWGFVYFRQKRDADLPRGYFQKSFILLTRLPFFNLFYEVIAQLGPLSLQAEDVKSVILQVCKQINTEWPALETGKTLCLPLFDMQYEINIPGKCKQKIPQTADALVSKESEENSNRDAATPLKFTKHIIKSLYELEYFQVLNPLLDDIYTLWELVITAEPIVVLGSSPAECSYMVQTLISLIHPLQYCGEFRPYFTIHDSEFKEFSVETKNKPQQPPNVILGVTNPYFTKLLSNWPHHIRMTVPSSSSTKQVLSKHNHQHLDDNSKRVPNVPGVDMRKSIASMTEGFSGLHTKYKPFLRKDKNVLKKVKLGIKTKRPDNIQSALVRKYLLELTQSFMIPLEHYVASLMPLQKDISPFKSAPNANSFKLEDFLATLEVHGPQLTSPLKGDWKGLYKKFYKSPNFRGWFNVRYRELQSILQDLQLQALADVDLAQWARGRQEVEIIDMILKLKHKVSTSNATGPLAQKIRSQIDCIKEFLPHDLKSVANI